LTGMHLFQRYQMGIWFEYSILQKMTVSETL